MAINEVERVLYTDEKGTNSIATVEEKLSSLKATIHLQRNIRRGWNLNVDVNVVFLLFTRLNRAHYGIKRIMIRL